MSLPLLILILILLLLLPIIVLLKSLIFKTNNHKLNLPPSPPKLPIIGNLHQLGSLPHRSLQSLSLKHGPLMLLHLGQTPTLVISSPQLVKQMVEAHDTTFSNRPQTTAPNIIFYNSRDMAFSPYGDYWAHLRKLCVQELLTTKSLHSFQHIRDREVESTIRKINERRIQTGFVDLSEMVQSVVSNIVSRCVFGRKADGGSNFGELSRKANVYLAEICAGDYFPWLRWADVVSGRIGRIKETFEALDGFLDEMIEEHRRGYVSGDDDGKDFMQILLQLQRNQMLDMELTLIDIKALLLDIIVAGIDTSSTVLEWTMSELIKNPHKMKKVQNEVRNVMAKDNTSKININHIKDMKYLTCVIKETLRLHPPAPLSLPRETRTALKLCGYNIPEKTTTFVNIFAIQRDPDIWYKPEEFIPERYLNNEMDYKGVDYEYLPFGGGRRGCPGMSFAIGMVEYVLANLLYMFDWKLFGSDEVDMSEVFGFTTSRRLPLLLEPKSYCP